jgi:hypothetical protein
MKALTIIATLTIVLAFLAVAAVRLGRRRRQLSPVGVRWLSQASTLVFLGGIGWLLCLVILANGLRGAPGVGMSELMLVGLATLFVLIVAALALLVVWRLSRPARQEPDPR